jgi:cytoskeletal protein RodZ
MRLPIRYSFLVPTVGEQLRSAREAQELELHDIVDLTKIQSDHLRALEEGDYSIFSAPVYIRGFVRTYATLLKLDTSKILEQLGHELADSGQVDPLLVRPEKKFLDAVMFQLSRFSRRLIWPAAGTAAAALVVVVAYVLWTHHRNVDPTIGLGAGLYQMPTNSGEILPLPVTR